MIDRALRSEILARTTPDEVWQGEPMLGAIYGEEEIEAVISTMRASMDWQVGFGFICQEITDFEKAFGDYIGVSEVISINGAGTGLDMMMRALELEPGDEVIVPAINFRASPLSVVGAGGVPVFAEVTPDTLQLDPNDVVKRLTSRTRAIFPTHMNGLSAPMDDYFEIAEDHPHPRHGPLKVIGDGARAVGGAYHGAMIGKKGWANVFSFHTMKNMTTLGEGGALTTDDPELALLLRGYRQFGGVNDGWGTNYKLTKVQAAVGLVQLQRLPGMIEARRRLAYERNALLDGVPELILPAEPPGHVHSYYLYTLLVPRAWAGEKRDRVLEVLKREFKIGALVGNAPVYESSSLLRSYMGGATLPLSDELGKRLFCIPIHPAMTREQNEYVSAAVIEAVERVRAEG
jgi:dTDP-4-amino-4,6-dideoxygalactose transaminase